MFLVKLPPLPTFIESTLESNLITNRTRLWQIHFFSYSCNMDQPLTENHDFKNKDYTTSNLFKTEYTDCTFTNCNFENSDLSNISFLECDFLDCNFSNANVMHTSFNDVTFKGCKILGVIFQSCNPFLLSFKFIDCTLNFSSFYQLKISKTNFLKCTMHQVDFTEAEAKYVAFKDCDLLGATFDRTNIEYSDFTSAFNFNINPALNKIKSASFSKENIYGLLESFHIKIIE